MYNLSNLVDKGKNSCAYRRTFFSSIFNFVFRKFPYIFVFPLTSNDEQMTVSIRHAALSHETIGEEKLSLSRDRRSSCVLVYACGCS